MRIDAHQHFWRPQRGDYHWMPKDNETLHRAYAPGDLSGTLSELKIDGTVLVQAAATLHETEYMLGLADATPWVKGVVGWVDFENPDDLSHLKRLAAHPKFLGVRPMIQDIPDVNWMLRDDVQWAFNAVCDLGLTFDALGFPQHQANFLTIAQRYSELRLVYDHCMKPQIRDQRAGKDAFGEWAAGISHLANETHGFCKLSGLVTEADDGWGAEDIKPFAQHVLEAFGPDRVMWGSDWPVCRLQTEYSDWHDLALSFCSELSADDQEKVFGGTARHFYQLD